MRFISKFAFGASLLLSLFAVQPGLAAAEEAAGHFTLMHEVHLQKQVLPAGEYRFSVKPYGPSAFLYLQNVGGRPFGAMLLVNDVETTATNEGDRLVLVSKNGQVFVSALELPNVDMVLRFRVPSDKEEQPLAARSLVEASSAR